MLLFLSTGLIVGAIIKYAYSSSSAQFLDVVPENSTATHNLSVPPDTLWLHLALNGSTTASMQNKTYAYLFKGEVLENKPKQIEQKVCLNANEYEKYEYDLIN